MNETYVMLPAAGSLTDFFTAISILANEYQTAGNGVLICIPADPSVRNFSYTLVERQFRIV